MVHRWPSRSAVYSAFKSFKDYNCPKKMKHRKREQRNLSCDQLCHLAGELSTLLQDNPWERELWCDFKHDVAGLAQSLVGSEGQDYVLHYVSTTPVQELSSNLRVKFLPASTAPTSLLAIEESMYPKPNFEYMSITDLLPPDPLKKHRCVETLTATGLRLPCVLLIYSPGSNIGNLHFLPSECIPATVFEQSQPVIENVKVVIPQSHTRAMRTALFDEYT